ncbi:MAG: hypothetical protein C4K60_03530 [Ideonella sp. MAG2]|nr:MAG: hypothetical protein C4K60_03530 [Ideonella sp. MAG2]
MPHGCHQVIKKMKFRALLPLNRRCNAASGQQKLSNPSVTLIAAALAAVALAGCETTDKKPAPTTSATVPATPSLQSFLDAGAKARKEGSRNKERDAYRAGAAAYPTSKQPWLKLAEGYFEEADYGNTILAAQEVLQRDAADSVATSMLAVSGLRVANTALTALRKQNNLGADTRSQAEGVAKQLREVLGEPVLVPKNEAGSPPSCQACQSV